LRKKYQNYFKYYDNGLVDLFFITNHKINQKQYESVKAYGIEIFHLDNVLQYLIEHIEGALPETEPLIFSDITSVLTPPSAETEIPTSIVFARLIDFISYMEDDNFDLLFARNVRLWLGKTETNKQIEITFKKNPKEFAYSNNGITLLCKSHKFDPGKKELHLTNPRVVNGSQTLHSIRNSDNPSKNARVMVRIIEVSPSDDLDISKFKIKRREIVHKISVRSNMQNPIRRWNLVSNDDYQNELAQFFWQKKFFYERRQFEWKFRRDELKSIGINQGPDIRWLTQLISSYHFLNTNLGPANAQGQLNTLFDEEPYSIIRTTSSETVYRLFLLGEIAYDYLYRLRNKRQYIFEVSGYIKFTLFSILCKAIRNVSPFIFLNDKGETFFVEEYHEVNEKFEKLVKNLIDYILQFYKKEEKIAMKEKRFLTLANFFKSKSYINPILQTRIPKPVINLTKQILNGY
jgi:hypothetical protein